MKLLIIGDPHLKISRFDIALKFLKWINSVVEEEKPDAVVNLGDTFDTHAVLRSEVKNEVMDHIVHCIKHSKSGNYFYILGNHDFYKPKSSKYHALKDWKNIDGLRVVDERLNLGAVNITMLPYYPDHREFPTDTFKICIAHQTFIGADYGFTRPDVGVDADKVDAEVIISGHIHLKQEFGKVIYPGSPFSQSVNDIDQVKGVMMFDTDTYERKFIECPLPKWISLEYSVDAGSNIQQVHEDLSKNLNDRDHWVVKITGPKAEITSYLSSKQYKELISNKSVQIKPTFTDKTKKLKQIKSVSIEKIMSEYFNNVYKGSIDKNQLISKANEILDSVKSK